MCAGPVSLEITNLALLIRDISLFKLIGFPLSSSIILAFKVFASSIDRVATISSDKSKAVNAVFSEKCHSILIEFIALIEKENIVKLIPLLEKYFNTLLIEKKNVVNVNAEISQEMKEDKKVIAKNLNYEKKKVSRKFIKQRVERVGYICLMNFCRNFFSVAFLTPEAYTHMVMLICNNTT